MTTVAYDPDRYEAAVYKQVSDHLAGDHKEPAADCEACCGDVHGWNESVRYFGFDDAELIQGPYIVYPYMGEWDRYKRTMAEAGIAVEEIPG